MARPRKKRETNLDAIDLVLSDGTHIFLDRVFQRATVYEVDRVGRRFDIGTVSILSMYRIMRSIAAEKRAERMRVDA